MPPYLVATLIHSPSVPRSVPDTKRPYSAKLSRPVTEVVPTASRMIPSPEFNVISPVDSISTVPDPSSLKSPVTSSSGVESTLNVNLVVVPSSIFI